jgi:hypothetical protein
VTEGQAGLLALTRDGMESLARESQKQPGHKNIQHATPRTELIAQPFRDFWARED